MKLCYGRNKQLWFVDEYDYYLCLGIMANSTITRIYIEDNQSRGSYTDAYRLEIQAYGINVPTTLRNAMRDRGRINCNEYVQNLINNHKFEVVENYNSNILSVIGNYKTVLKTVPVTYVDAFMQGYNSY